jgi:hypothetical protein
MKRMLFLGALVLGVTVCSQSFGFELFNKMLGHKGCSSCCEPGCDADGCCEPACGAGGGCGAEPACGAAGNCCEPACDAGAGCCEPSCGAAPCKKRCRGTPILDLLRAVHNAKKNCLKKSSCTGCCGEPDCGAGCCEPGCGAEPACGACASTPAVAPAPTPDASAAKQTRGKVVAVSRTVSSK